MNNIKLDTELYIALNTSEEEREKSMDLNEGFNGSIDEWELIIKYIGDLNEIGQRYNAFVTELLGGFGIIRIKSNQIEALTMDSDVIYIDKPKVFYEERTVINGFTASCMDTPYYIKGLLGNGVLVTIIDSGERVIIMSS